MKHEDIWRALDTLAAENGLSTSGLAKRSGLDPTTFNLSKRTMPDGRQRWPSTESVAKALNAVGADLETFTAFVTGARPTGEPRPAGEPRPKATPRAQPAPHSPTRASAQPKAPSSIPLIGLTQAGSEGYFDDAGYPVGGAWDEVTLPDVGDAHAYALEISGESMEPVFRDGDMVIVSPAAPVRRGDRVVVRTSGGEVMAKQLVRRSARRLELRSLNPQHPDYSFELGDVAWMHRIIWASQ